MTNAVVRRPDGTVRTTTVESAADLSAVRDADGVTWVDATGGDEDALALVSEAFALHDLSAEDVRVGGRAKVEEFDEYTLVRVNSVEDRTGSWTVTDSIRDVSLGLFVGSDWLVSYSTEPLAAVDGVRDALVRGRGRIRERGPDFLAYLVVTTLIEEYFRVLDDLEARLERIEDAVIDDPSSATLEEINDVRRDLLAFRRLVWPTREAIATLALGDVTNVDERTRRYYRDAYEELVELVELTETYRDLASGSRDIYLNTVAMSTNEVMKKLTVVATIVLPLTFVAGVYGMNFEGSPYNMPELAWTFGYPATMLGMLAVAVILLVYFRREGWL
jgi:magnesium transporter